MTLGNRLPGLAAALAVGVALSACASRPIEHFYTVSTPQAASDGGAGAQAILVQPIVIPALIDRPQFVVRTSPHELMVLENHRWAEPLSADLTRALVNDLRRIHGGLGVAAEASRAGAQRQVLEVTVSELLAGPDSTTSFRASWALRDRLRNCVSAGSLEADLPTAAGHSAIPDAYAAAMARLADAITRTIEASGPCPE